MKKENTFINLFSIRFHSSLQTISTKSIKEDFIPSAVSTNWANFPERCCNCQIDVFIPCLVAHQPLKYFYALYGYLVGGSPTDGIFLSSNGGQ